MSDRIICLDVGEKRIGVAVADLGVKIAIPLTTIEVDGTEIEQILRLYNHLRKNASPDKSFHISHHFLGGLCNCFQRGATFHLFSILIVLASILVPTGFIVV